MYNGIGLATPRGSGTSGYIQRNLSFIKPKRTDFEPGAFDKSSGPNQSSVLTTLLQHAPAFDGDSGPKIRKANSTLLAHNRRRKIESELLELHELLEKKGLSKKQVEERVAGRRAVLVAQLEREEVTGESHSEIDPDKLDSHQSAELKNRELNNLRKAFRIDDAHKPGRAFDPEEMEKRKLVRLQQRQIR
eukprot:GHVN01051164.1.p1 GENE.GHVN01051164.1~~GHVN01051164.1.p1  ORF type:complete len:190 (-),score=20.93 GHVN01051164.1:125-694(-)